MTQASALQLDPTNYSPHALHGENSVWQEKNCYIDVWIELVHALGLDPLGLLPFTVSLDFVDDQWVFYKPAHRDLFELYGIEVQELNIWRPLADHALTHLAKGRLILSEVDAYFLPDTQGTDYRRQHTKTTIALESIDLEAHELRYFHNKSYYSVDGDDFAGLLRPVAPTANALPLFAELVRLERVKRRPQTELVELSSALLRKYFAERPQDNPVARFAEQFARDLETLSEQGILVFHAYAFATLRQLGSNFELLSAYLAWLAEHQGIRFEPAAAHFKCLSDSAQLLILKGARAVNSKKIADFSEQLSLMTRSWEEGMRLLRERLES